MLEMLLIIIVIDETISCLSGNKGGILVGTTGGDVITFSEDNLTQKHKFTNAVRISYNICNKIWHSKVLLLL